MTNGCEPAVAGISVVVASLYDRSSLESCLDSILADKSVESEIIVVDRCLNGSMSELAEKYSDVNFVQFPVRTSLQSLLASGIGRSTADIIALTDASCVVGDRWISSIMKAHAGDWPVVGGSVEVASNTTLTSWAAHFCDYSQFMTTTVRAGLVSAVPGNNLSLKREALKIGGAFVKDEFWKTHWCRSLQAKGSQLFLEPAIKVRVRKVYKMRPFLRRRFDQGRCFAGIRAEQHRPWKRVLFAAGTFVLPLLFLFRTAPPVLRQRQHWGKFLATLPLIFAAFIVWSAGEAAGYLNGPGMSCRGID
jgi:hypothetical protein